MKFNILILFLIFSSRLMSQNLVPDPTFDMPFDCSRPYFSFYGIPWYTPNKKSSDSYHECKRDILGTVPYNAQGYQKPASGKGYAGIRTIIAWEGMAPDLPYREYISSKLSGKLEKDSVYYLAFKYSVGDRAYYATDNIGLHVGIENPAIPASASSEGPSVIFHFTPHVYNPMGKILTDSINWNIIHGYYKANGGEEYVTIGNFYEDYQTSVVDYNTTNAQFMGSTYFFIDDVVVAKCSEYTPQVSIGSDTLLCKGQGLKIDVSIREASVIWNDNRTEQIRIIDESGSYWVKFITPCGEFYSDTIHIKVIDCENPVFPNIITPNGDGVNDFFSVTSLTSTPVNLSIFNRWGKVMYESSDYKDDWNGQNLIDGVYYYVLKNNFNKSYKGLVHVLR